MRNLKIVDLMKRKEFVDNFNEENLIESIIHLYKNSD